MEEKTPDIWQVVAIDVEACDHDTGPADSSIVHPSAIAAAPLPRRESHVHGSRPLCFSNTFEECLFVLTTTFAMGQPNIFSGATVPISTRIGHDLHMNAAEITWMNAGQFLAAGCFLLFFGRVADLFGRRMMLVLSLASFSACMLIMGFATNALYMDIFCALSGVCSAAAVPPAIGKLSAVYGKPSRRKNRAFACFSAGKPVGFALGAFTAGVATTIANWRVTFWALSVLFAVFSAIAWWTVPADVEMSPGRLDLETLQKFDFLGAFLAIAGIGMLTASLTLAGTAPSGWRTNYVIALLLAGVVLSAMFVYWQSIFAYPLMPLTVWRDRNFSILVAISCLGTAGFFGMFFWLTLIWQRIQALSPILIAVRLLPAMIGGIGINVIVALIMHRVSNTLLVAVAALGYVGAFALLGASHVDCSYWAFAFPALIFGIVGTDFEFTVTSMYVMSSLPSEQQSVAGGLFNTLSRLSAAIGLGIQTSVYNSLGGAATPPGSLAYRPYQGAFWVALALSGVALFLLPFLRIGSQGARRRMSEYQDRSWLHRGSI